MQTSDTITISAIPVEPLSDGASPGEQPPPKQITVPRQLGPVKMQRELGRGGMGVVWLGWHEFLSRDVAVKFMLHAVETDDPGFTMFLAGARAASAVRHLGLTQIHHADVIEGVPYIVMEYVDGFSAADLLDRFGVLSIEASVAIMRQVCDAVAELHERSIVHRDMKPSNILIDDDGRAYVTDFGLTCLRPQGEARVAGTPAYMSPETLLGQVSPRSDVYSLGVSMCELLTGSRTLSQLADNRIDARLIELIERATKQDPIYRFKTARHLHRALADLGGKPADDERTLVRLIAQMRAVGTNSPDAIIPQAGSGGSGGTGGGNYFETIATLAKKKESERGHAPATPSTVPTPPPVPAPQTPERKSWFQRLFGN